MSWGVVMDGLNVWYVRGVLCVDSDVAKGMCVSVSVRVREREEYCERVWECVCVCV